jgi:hypothetical protein
MASELEPVFRVKVFLDGDDDAAMQTENAEAVLKIALETMQRDVIFAHSN